LIAYNNFDNPLDYPFHNGPDELGPLTQTNANGDPCDVYYNLYMDPLLVDFPGGDYHLTVDSPCIDAGDLAFPLDPDDTITDIGVYFFDQSTVGVDTDPAGEFSTALILRQPYPNPFNPVTTFAFELPVASWIELAVYDVRGEFVTTVLDGWHGQGKHRVEFDANGLSSGIYLYRLRADDLTACGKMVLLQ